MTTPIEFAEKLKGKSEEEIKQICLDLMTEIQNICSTPKERKNKLDGIKKQINKVFPRTENKEHNYQYFREKGRQDNKNRYQHLALKYLTLSSEDWDELSDENRKQWLKTQANTGASEVHAIANETEELTEAKKEETVSITVNLDKMMQDILKEALANSGLTQEEYIAKAIEVYAKTVNRKSKKQNEDLTVESTEKLLNDPSYSVHPKRAEELVKRAIEAIKIYNAEVATEPEQRWIITQSILTELTKSRASTVQEIMKRYQSEIDSYHLTRPEFFKDGVIENPINLYWNRKKGVSVKDAIDLAKLVPNGI